MEPVSFIIQYMDHTDPPGTVCEEMTQGCEYQETGIVGGNLGGWLPHLPSLLTFLLFLKPLSLEWTVSCQLVTILLHCYLSTYIINFHCLTERFSFEKFKWFVSSENVTNALFTVLLDSRGCCWCVWTYTEHWRSS